LDVDAWLGTITPEQFDEWMAFERIEGNEMARLREIIKVGFASLCPGGKVQPDDFDATALAEQGHVTPNQAARVFRQHAGG
jgi:hypothetical protein